MPIYNPNTGEGRCPNDGTGSDSFATVRGAGTCSTATDGTLILLTSTSGSTYRIHRVFLPFDTSSIPDTATITSATLDVYRDDGVTGFNNTDTTSIHVVTQTQASNTSLATSDYGNVSFTSKGSANFSSTSNGAYITITISDLTIISTTGHTKLALLTGRDQGNSAPTGANTIGFQNRSAGNPPKLTVGYTTQGGSFLATFI